MQSRQRSAAPRGTRAHVGFGSGGGGGATQYFVTDLSCSEIRAKESGGGGGGGGHRNRAGNDTATDGPRTVNALCAQPAATGVACQNDYAFSASVPKKKGARKALAQPSLRPASTASSLARACWESSERDRDEYEWHLERGL